MTKHEEDEGSFLAGPNSYLDVVRVGTEEFSQN